MRFILSRYNICLLFFVVFSCLLKQLAAADSNQSTDEQIGTALDRLVSGHEDSVPQAESSQYFIDRKFLSESSELDQFWSSPRN